MFIEKKVSPLRTLEMETWSEGLKGNQDIKQLQGSYMTHVITVRQREGLTQRC